MTPSAQGYFQSMTKGYVRMLAMLLTVLLAGAGAGAVNTQPVAKEQQANPVAASTDSTLLPFPDNLVVDGVPPVPQSLAEKVALYSNVRYAELQDWHPQKKEILIRTRFADTAQIHAVKFPDGARTQLTFSKEPAQGALFEPCS